MAAATQQLAWGRFTLRRDAWWLQPLLVILGLGGFGVYSTFRVFENAHYVAGLYQSPLGSPDLRSYVPWLQGLVPFTVSPALIILPFPLLFRLTCYYYRKAYYRSFFTMPPACAVRGASSKAYPGERGIFLLQNLHRFFLYLAIVILLVLWYDVLAAFGLETGKLYVGLGGFLFLGNVLLLSGYTFGCHSLRHLVGGKLDCYSCDKPSQVRHGLWQRVSRLNANHMGWAWASLFSIWAVDLFVRFLDMGLIHDVRLL